VTILRHAPPIAIDADEPLVLAALAAGEQCGIRSRVRRMCMGRTVEYSCLSWACARSSSIGLSDLAAAAQIYESTLRSVLEMSNDS
jgi:hypothetical protein